MVLTTPWLIYLWWETVLEPFSPSLSIKTLVRPKYGTLTKVSHFHWCCSVTKSCLILCDPHRLQHARLPCPPLSPGVCSNSCPLILWCHPIISSSVTPWSPCPASVSFPTSWLFASDGQNTGASASVYSNIPVNIQDWFPLGWTVLISLPSKGLSRVFSSTTVWKHQFPLSWRYLERDWLSHQNKAWLGKWNGDYHAEHY